MADPPEPDPVIGFSGYAPGTRQGSVRPRPRRPPYESDPLPPADSADEVSVLGLPEKSLTPEVSAALRSLMDEIGRLRWEMSRAVRRLVLQEQQASRDPVLPVLGRRAFMRELGAFIGRTDVAGALAFFYLESYELLRRTRGLAAAEQALRLMASALLGSVRDTDLVGAVGGGGIAVALVVSEAPGTRSKADSLLESLGKVTFHWGDEDLPLDASCGLHEFAAGETAEEALAAADTALRLSPLRRRQAMMSGSRRLSSQAISSLNNNLRFFSR